MFEKLVLSTTQRRKHTTAKFFAGTVLLYAIVLACAIIVSVVVSDPKLADTSKRDSPHRSAANAREYDAQTPGLERAATD